MKQNIAKTSPKVRIENDKCLDELSLEIKKQEFKTNSFKNLLFMSSKHKNILLYELQVFRRAVDSLC